MGEVPKLYRPPGGTLSYEVIDVASAAGMQVVGWSVDSQDYQPGRTAEAISGRVLRLVHPSAVVLLHDGGGDRSATVAQLRGLVRALRARGHDFVVPSPGPPAA